jgi:SagB-type dehydrogenase family enzyme
MSMSDDEVITQQRRLFHGHTKNFRNDVAAVARLEASKGLLKGRLDSFVNGTPNAGAKVVELPSPVWQHSVPFNVALDHRRSAKDFSPGPLPLEPDGMRKNRTAPSAGALYPLGVYAATSHMRGLYRFVPVTHSLEVISECNAFAAIAGANVQQHTLLRASAVIVITGIFHWTCLRYGLRGYRYVLLEAGHVAQNVLLSAAALGLAAIPIGSFADSEIDRLIGLDGEDESALLLIAIGNP